MPTSEQEESRKHADAWIILTTLYGEDIDNPSPQQLRLALGELFDETISGLSEEDYDEHPNAWLRYGFDEGPMYVLDVYRRGGVIFSKYADQADSDALWEYRMDDVSQEKALVLWQHLIEGKLGELKAEEWQAGT